MVMVMKIFSDYIVIIFMCNNGYNDTGIQLGKIGWIIDRFECFVFMDWHVLDICIEQLKFYDNMGCLFDAELHHPPSWDFLKGWFL